MPPANSYQYCLTVVDRFTRWPEVWPLKRNTAEDVAEALLNCWISRFGAPTCITTDQGREFESALFRALGEVCGSERHRTCSYHPCANGMVERLHRQLKSALMCHEGTSWIAALPLVLLGIRSAFRPDLNASSAELVYGQPLRLPGEMIAPSNSPERYEDVSDLVVRLRRKMAELRPVPGSSHAKPHQFVFQDLDSCSHVFLRDDAVRKRLQQPYTGPHPVAQRDDKTVTILVNNAERRVSIDRVKPAFTIQDEAVPGPDPASKPPSSSSPPPPTTVDSAGGSESTSITPSSTSTPSADQGSALAVRRGNRQTNNNSTRPTYTTRYGRRVRFRLP
ncbi:uncharacterized protein LOC127750579 [Frankliniella occidentalis]|uniref:Uncharacterized protein LOC127750579 n=1 Tax=Frankliniella occidentalis TaxID=133901 RepID=A0A9C6XRI2_FRAOC|nr:uncharacterized protein LOC127750579 [Frankliniella occidentalis]